MFGFPSFHEFFIFVLIIVLLSATGLWPAVKEALRDLRGESAPPPPSSASRTDVDLSFRLLGLSPSASMEEVERAYRQKAKIHHPDRGGDGDTMRALNEAYNLIKRVKRL